MAARQGFTPWAETKTWPSGSAAGHLAVFVSLTAGIWPKRPKGTEGWRVVGRYQQVAGGDARWATWTVQVFQKVLTAADLAAAPPSGYGQITVLSGTAGIGAVRTGLGEVVAQPGGGVLSITYTDSDAGTDLQAGPAWQLPPAKVNQASIFGPTSSRTVVGWSTVSSASTMRGWGRFGRSMAVEILPPRAPLPPNLLSPSDGEEVTSSGTITFAWQHRPSVADGRQDAYRLRFDGGSGWRWWNASTNSLVTSEYTNLSAVQTLDVAASKFTALVGEVWQGATREATDGLWSDYAAGRSFLPVTPPSVTLTGPSTVHNNLTPKITWQSTTPRGEQTAYRVQIVDSGSALLVHDSRPMPGDAEEYQLPRLPWVRNGQYLRRVQVQQTGGSWSAWVEEPLAMTWDLPAAPTVSATEVADGIKVTVSVSSTMRVTLERIGVDGIWKPIVGAQVVSSGSPLVVTDPFAPYGVPTRYRAKGLQELSGQFLDSDYAQSGLVTSTNQMAYIALAENPTATWLPITMVETPERETAEHVATTYPLGDDYGQVAYGPTQGESSSVKIWVAGEAEADNLRALLETQRSLLVRWKPQVRSDGTGEWTTGKLQTWARSSRYSVEDVLPPRPGQPQIQARRFSFSWIEQPDEVPDSSVTV